MGSWNAPLGWEQRKTCLAYACQCHQRNADKITGYHKNMITALLHAARKQVSLVARMRADVGCANLVSTAQHARKNFHNWRDIRELDFSGE
jgi:hypothetical protein